MPSGDDDFEDEEGLEEGGNEEGEEEVEGGEEDDEFGGNEDEDEDGFGEDGNDDDASDFDGDEANFGRNVKKDLFDDRDLSDNEEGMFSPPVTSVGGVVHSRIHCIFVSGS